MRTITRERILPTLEQYNASRLLSSEIVSGREFRRLRRAGKIGLI